MVLIWSIVGVAVAAFCVWLTVRIVNRKERWAKRLFAWILSVPVLYILSFGPACWITSHMNAGDSALPIVYWPMTQVMSASSPAASALHWYARLYAAGGWYWGSYYTDSSRQKSVWGLVL
jgi:hypothetical protein